MSTNYPKFSDFAEEETQLEADVLTALKGDGSCSYR
jgi:hypothetical protein